jgi:hypothetical protein
MVNVWPPSFAHAFNSTETIAGSAVHGCREEYRSVDSAMLLFSHYQTELKQYWHVGDLRRLGCLIHCPDDAMISGAISVSESSFGSVFDDFG